MKKLRGKPPLYESPQELLDYFYSYIEDCKLEKKVPNRAGFTVFCFGGDTTRKTYEGKDDYRAVFECIYANLEDETINSNNIDSNIKNLILKSKYKYSDKQEIDLRSDSITIQLTKSTWSCIYNRRNPLLKIYYPTL